MDDTTEKKNAASDTNYKDTVESILIAFILAFIFRAFVVEAFVIPTGSMAPTLYGAHTREHCPDCGYTFDVGVQGSESVSGDDIDIPDRVTRNSNIQCPNCGYIFRGGRDATEPVRFGDRILVLKYLYLFQKPLRWDVVVFKAPTEPQKTHVANDAEYSQNYIKRLIGNPNESIVILDGDIYVGNYNAKDYHDKWTIQRKPKYVQDALWRIVCDNDFVPRNPVLRSNSASPTWIEPWQVVSGDGWNTGSGDKPARAFAFDNLKGESTLFFNTGANGSTPREWMAYDQIESPSLGNWVSDLKLSFFYTRQQGAGPLRLQLTKLNSCFTVEIEGDKATLYRSTLAHPSDASTGRGFDAGKLEPIASAQLPELAGPAPVRIDFANVDYRVSLRVNGHEAISSEYDPNIADLWKRAMHGLDPDEPFARPEIRMTSQGQKCRIEHLSLWRDVYYGNTAPTGTAFWASPGNPVHLKSDEYFVLGDNSPISGDARYWQEPVRLPHEGLPFVQAGRVPERFMLGKAFFVYWPAGYRLPYLPLNAVPDFGEMRFIH